MLVSGSMHDDRVPYWLPLRWTAKLRNVLKDRRCAQSQVEGHQKQSSVDGHQGQLSLDGHSTQPSVDRNPLQSRLLLCTIDYDGGHFGSGGLHGTLDEVNRTRDAPKLLHSAERDRDRDRDRDRQRQKQTDRQRQREMTRERGEGEREREREREE